MPDSTSEDRLNRYMDAIKAQLSWASNSWREEQLAEIRAHVVELYNAKRSEELAEDAAMDAALTAVGKPELIGKQLLHQWKLDVAKAATLKTLRIGARATSAVIVVFTVVFAVGEGVPTGNIPLWERGMFAALIITLAGMLIGWMAGRLINWKYERLGGAVCVAGVVLFDALNYASSGKLPAASMQLVPIAVGLAYIAASALDRNTKSQHRSA